MGRRLLPLACVLLLSLSAVAASQWIDINSHHFHVLTDTSEKQGRDVAQRFEQMRAVFGTMFHRSTLNSPVPLDIVAFRTQDEFMRYVPLWKGKPVSLTGFFQGSEDRDFIGIEMSSSDPFGTVSHEYAHLLLRDNFPVMPLWFEEGFAEYFSTLQVAGDKAQYGAAPSQYAALLNSTQWMPITALFSVQHDSDAYNESDQRSIFYAESWLAVHYLLSNNRLVDAFKYLHLAQIEKIPVPDAIQQAFGVDAATFEKNLREHLASSFTPTTVPMPDVNQGTYVTRKISDFEAQAVLADMHAHSVDYQHQAEQEFEAILKADPGNEIANRGLGYWYLKNEHYTEAAAAFQRALLANDNDAQAHYLVAYLMNRIALKQGTAPNNPAIMRGHLEKALQIDPNFADATNLLAFALLAEGRYDAAIRAEMHAIELNPSAEIYQANLAHIYIQSERWSDAEALLKRLQTSSDPKIRDNAIQNLSSLAADRSAAAERKRVAALGVTDPTAPQWKMTPDIQARDNQQAEEESDKPDTRKTLYMSGELLSVDCSAEPVAIVKVRKGPKILKLRTRDYKKLMVMGADSFSCGWRDKHVLINYKPGGKADGDLVTLELQDESGK